MNRRRLFAISKIGNEVSHQLPRLMTTPGTLPKWRRSLAEASMSDNGLTAGEQAQAVCHQ
ncbi:hypothetical protein BHS30_29200 [Klebsiella pneumoniae]|nr:hypothetical protein BHS30_29200 [Klebsiella pneumoniae]